MELLKRDDILTSSGESFCRTPSGVACAPRTSRIDHVARDIDLHVGYITVVLTAHPTNILRKRYRKLASLMMSPVCFYDGLPRQDVGTWFATKASVYANIPIPL